MKGNEKTFDTAGKRWEGIGPYYAMFPIRFVESVIMEYSSVGESVIDPFAGRGSSVFNAAVLGRQGLGVEINPVGWVYTKTKLRPAPLEQVEKRLLQIVALSNDYAKHAETLPVFFQHCFSFKIRKFLLAARAELDWRRKDCDRTLMTFLLIYLHGKKGQALSNQMMQTKSMSPQYAVKWWSEKAITPPDLDIVHFMQKRIHWRYAKGTVDTSGSRVYLGDSIKILPQLVKNIGTAKDLRPKLLLTSPPYHGVTNYYYDQWLRLWLLGFESNAYKNRGPHKGRFTNIEQYQKLLIKVFNHSSKIMSEDAVIYVRTSNSPVTKEATLIAMQNAFPKKKLVEKSQPYLKPTQTHLFGDKTSKVEEVDLIMLPSI